MNETPRLSTYIRAFGHVSHPDDKFLEEDEKKDFEILKRRLLAKRKEEEDGKVDDDQSYFGAKIPFDPIFFEPTVNDEAFKCLSRPDPGQFLLRNQINFDYKEPEAGRITPQSKYTMEWLELQLGHSATGLSAAELSLTLVEILKSSRSNDDLQTELFDLLGFDRIQLIQELLEHRHTLIQSHALNKKVLKSEIAQAAASNSAGLNKSKPMYGCQVLVQSEDERQLRKQVLKEEKKINKILKAIQDDSDEETFDPKALAMKRQSVALASVMSKPLLQKEKSPAFAVVEKYPFVFDNFAEAKMSAGFIQGTKMVLPLGFERKDDKKAEEVFIPATAKAPAEIGRNLVAISSLDYIGQMAFQGMKSLNRIQSVVFDAAYRTNENLLVCAPTGAGKTNVAMLCIAQTIRQFMDNDVIRKDAFKIVYVAPMKALAAEMTANFSKRLAPLGLTVRELTGDMQLTKTEIMQTQMLVTTPEKWDVVTRKPGDVSLSQLVRLLIIDEVHLLHGDRGPVIEALVARTLRMVESSQTVIRIVGLSATLPNYLDVAQFLRVNPYLGLFFFDGRFRPVPLAQTFVGIKALNSNQQATDMNELCYEKVLDFVRKGHQVMVFVHARNATVKTGMALLEMAQNRGHTETFLPDDSPQLGTAQKAISKSRNKQLVELFNAGFGIHHAGMLRSDRSMVEKLFGQGFIKVLVCTATLAWGVNLPAHAVIIKGTEIYNAKQGGFVDVGILDVLQIFGRAGRPQFDTSGHGTIITTHDKLSHYLSLLTNQFPIESNFLALLADNLNAEISLGTVTNVEEAVQWLSYSYLYVRMRKNPLVYGLKYQDVKDDPTLEVRRSEVVREAARKLDKAKMIRFDERTGYLFPTDYGRTASQFYIKYDTIEVFNELLKPVMNEADILSMLSQATEFEQLKVRDDEMDELDDLTHEYCQVPVFGGSENVHGKVNILLQTHISRGQVRSFSLISDLNYVVTNASRIARALFEIGLRRNWPLLAGRILKFAKTIERQLWDFESPLRQHPQVKAEILHKLEARNFTIDKLRELDSKEIGHLIHHVRAGPDVKKAAFEVPLVEMEATIQPITRTVLRVRLAIVANFRWNDRLHGSSEPFWVWVEDPINNHIYHSEFLLVAKKNVVKKENLELVFTIPIFEPLPTQYYVRAMSDRWVGSESYCTISFQHLILPEKHPPHTNLLDLQPLPKSALNDPSFQSLYKFDYFNPIQSQIFFTLYNTDKNVLLGAPTGSGKTIAAEIAMFKVFRDYPGGKVVYIAPLKALVRERMEDWKVRLQEKLGKNVVELTGDITPDVRAILRASVIVTTPEKWDAVSRSWQTRSFVQAVRLIVIDEIHLLGEDRGPVLEVIVSRTNFISSHTSNKLRIIGLSTALANAKDLADWLGIENQTGLFNFRPSVRPVPLEVHISGYPGKHYCPRMATMNKPTFQAIQQHSPTKPTLIFVASRRQTRVTALDLIAFLAGEDNPKMWLHMDESEMERLATTVKDQNLKLTLAFGIGMHHAGLVDRDRKVVEELFVNQKIQVLIATATVAWGVNFPAHLVVIKGTEYYDGKLKRYVDMPITDVLQMMGRAGRPQYDDHGVACVLVHDVKKHFYKKFLYEPFPVESSLLGVLPDHLNAEIVAGTISTKQEALDYMTWTYFFRRLLQNPSYYGLDGVDEHNINVYLTGIVQEALNKLHASSCIDYGDDDLGLFSTTLGKIASYYYLSHCTVQHFKENLSARMSLEEILQVLCDASEFDQLPVRHNEDLMNADLAKSCPIDTSNRSMESSNTKTLLLLQAHFSRLQMPCSDYYTDLKSVLDQTIRILQAMIDVCAENGWLATTLQIQNIMQMVIQGRWIKEHPIMTLPHFEQHMLYLLRNTHLDSIPELWQLCQGGKSEPLARILRQEMEEGWIDDFIEALHKLPQLKVDIFLSLDGKAKFPIEKTRELHNAKWIDVGVDMECTLIVDLLRVNRLGRNDKAYAPRFAKPQDEAWFLVLGNVDDNMDMLALKRVSTVRGSTSQQITFWTPDRPGRAILTLYVMSDSYLGLDQQYDIHLNCCE